MAQNRMFACEECGEEFVVAAGRYACLGWVLRCPCCGCTDVLLIVDAAQAAAVDEAA